MRIAAEKDQRKGKPRRKTCVEIMEALRAHGLMSAASCSLTHASLKQATLIVLLFQV